MKILFVDSGMSSFETRYAYAIEDTFKNDFRCQVRHINPFHLTHQIIDQFKPDLVLVIHGTFTALDLIHYAKSRGTTTVLWLVEDPYEIDSHRGPMVAAYDFVFTTERQAVTEYNHSRVFYLPWCCNPRINRHIVPPPAYHSDICMVGVGFPNRVRILNTIAPALTGLKVKLIGNWGEQLVPQLRKCVISTISDFWEIQKYYCGAKINLNIHRDPVNPPSGNSKQVSGTSPNDRTFALAGSGAFQLVDNTRPDIWNCFVENREMVSFTDPHDLIGKIQKYLGNSNLRQAICQAGQKKAYGQHTFKHRFAEIFRLIGTPLPLKYRIIQDSYRTSKGTASF